jgi:molecular chaperone DnaK (HSP70)
MSIWAAIAVLAFGCAVVIWLYVPRRRRRPQRPEYLADPLGVVTLSGEFVTLLPATIELPAEGHEVYATSAPTETELAVDLGWGEAGQLEETRFRARFRVLGIRPGPPDVPRIEVVFRVERDASLHLRARDLMYREPLTVEPRVLPTPQQDAQAPAGGRGEGEHL